MVILAVVSDLHTNSTVALSPDRLTLDDGVVVEASKLQRWINERWGEYWQAVSDLKDHHGCDVVTLINGELADDNYHATTQLITKHKGDQAKAALAVLELPQLVSDRIICTRGTEAHVGLNGGIDEALARAIGAEPDSNGHHARWNARLVLEGVRIDAAHHPGTSSRRPWTRGAAANRLAQMVIDRYTRRRMLPPDLVFRGHVHQPEDSGNNHVTRAIITPAWQAATSFGHRLGGDMLPIGGHVFLLDGGSIVFDRALHWDWPLEEVEGW